MVYNPEHYLAMTQRLLIGGYPSSPSWIVDGPNRGSTVIG